MIKMDKFFSNLSRECFSQGHCEGDSQPSVPSLSREEVRIRKKMAPINFTLPCGFVQSLQKFEIQYTPLNKFSTK